MHRWFIRRILWLLPGNRDESLHTGGNAGPCFYISAIFLTILVVSQSACFLHFLWPFHKSKAPAAQGPPPAVVRLALLPFNIPSDNTDLRWVSLAAPVIMAKTMEGSQQFELIPLWEGVPVAVESLGATRSITPEVAAYVASRVSAKWATDGDLTPGKDGVNMLLDFIPAKATMVAYRYEKEIRVEALGDHFYEALNQFLRYLASPPMEKMDSKVGDTNAVRELAEALDKEYGWYVAADPGKAEKVVGNLVRTDIKLARLLFNPSLYPSLGVAPAPARPIDVKPVIPPPPEKPAPEPPPTKPTPPPVTEPPPAASVAQPQPEPTPSPPPSVSPPPPRDVPQGTSPSSTPDSPHTSAPPTTKLAAIPAAPPEPTRDKQQVAAHPEAAPSNPGKTSSHTFMVQVLSSQKREDAVSMANQLEKEGFKTEIEEVDLREKGIWYRLRMIGFASRASAKEAAEKEVAAGIVKEYWLIP